MLFKEVKDEAILVVVQTLLNAGESGVLKVEGNSKEGILVIGGGRVVHAECEGKTGEPAAIELLTITKGNVTVSEIPKDYNTVTVKKPALELLLEAARIIDEGETGQGADRDVDLGNLPPEKLENVVDSIISIPQVMMAAVYSDSGEVLVNKWSGEFSPDFQTEGLLIAVQAMDSSLEKLSDDLRSGNLKLAILEFDENYLIIGKCSGGVLVVIDSKDIPLGFLRTRVISALSKL